MQVFLIEEVNSPSFFEKYFKRIGVVNDKILINCNIENLKVSTKIELFRKIKDRYNKNIIILSSDVSFVLDFCDDYILLNDGCIVSQGSVSDLINHSDSLLASGLKFRDEYYFYLLARKRYNVNIKGSTCDDIIKDVIDNV